MKAARRPTRAQVRRRRAVAAGVAGLVLLAAAYLAFSDAIFGPSNAELAKRNGDQLVHIEIHSKAVGRDLGVNVIVPPLAGPRGKRGLLVYLHGRGGYEGTFNDAVLRGLPLLSGPPSTRPPSHRRSTGAGRAGPTHR